MPLGGCLQGGGHHIFRPFFTLPTDSLSLWKNILEYANPLIVKVATQTPSNLPAKSAAYLQLAGEPPLRPAAPEAARVLLQSLHHVDVAVRLEGAPHQAGPRPHRWVKCTTKLTHSLIYLLLFNLSVLFSSFPSAGVCH